MTTKKTAILSDTFAKSLDKKRASLDYLLFDTPSALADYAGANPPANYDSGASEAWQGYATGRQSGALCRTGDLSRVAPSDALLSRFERFAFAAPRNAWIDDVTGAIPNVQAYIAGQPLNMRRRVKLETAQAPLAIIVDLATSAGINARDIEKRGAAILALVRILSARRPVELWAGCALGANSSREKACAIYTRIETSPLDLATAAHVLVSASFPRALVYGMARKALQFDGGWPFHNDNVARRLYRDMIAPIFPHFGEFLAIPAAHMHDEIHKGPEAWIEKTLESLESSRKAE
jgi:hypothetical protein